MKPKKPGVLKKIGTAIFKINKATLGLIIPGISNPELVGTLLKSEAPGLEKIYETSKAAKKKRNS
jgi:hypothetical protein